MISADLSIDLDDSLAKDLLDFGVVQGVLQTIAKEEVQRKALA